MKSDLLSEAEKFLPSTHAYDNPRLIECPIDIEAQELEAAAMAELYSPSDLDPESYGKDKADPLLKEARTKLIEKDLNYIRTCDDETLSTVLLEGGTKLLRIIAESPELFVHLLERHGNGLNTQWMEWFGIKDRNKIQELTNTVKMHSIKTLLDLLNDEN